MYAVTLNQIPSIPPTRSDCYGLFNSTVLLSLILNYQITTVQVTRSTLLSEFLASNIHRATESNNLLELSRIDLNHEYMMTRYSIKDYPSG